MADNFGLKIGVEGEKEFKRALSDINQSFKVLGSEMKLVESEFGKNENSVQSLTSKNEVLNKQIDAQKDKIETLRKALENASSSFGENDRRTQAWVVQLNNAQAELNGMERELEQSADSADELGDELKKAGADAESSGGKFEKLGGVLKGVGAALGAATVAAGAAAILIFLYTGIRKGELSALEWSDIDFDAKTITIQRNMQYIRKIGLVTNSTKTESGERIISMSQSLAEFLKSYKAWQAEQRLKVGKDWVDRNRLFTRFNGDFIAPSTVYHWVKDFMVKNGFPDMHVHAMRHTNISLLLSQGVDLITASRRAGHSRASTTANIYAHALRRPDEAAAEKLESLLAGRQVAQ